MNYKPQILKPSTEQEFESLCAHIYGVTYNCNTPAMYGRRGQKQHGLDILISENNNNHKKNRIGLQCKHVKKLSFDNKSGDSIMKEVDKADKGVAKISKLIVLTSLPSDQNLIDKVNILSDSRHEKGLFQVEIQFWNDIENRINENQTLSERYYGNKSFDTQIELAEKFYNSEKYKNVIETLNSETLKLMNHVEKFRSYILLASTYLCLEKKSEFKKYLKELKQFKWNDARYRSLLINELLSDEKKDKASSLLTCFLNKYPANKAYQELELIININNNQIDKFDDIPEEFQSSYNVQLSYLQYTLFNQLISDFYQVFEKLDVNDKKKPSALAHKINADMMRLYKTKNDREQINHVLDSFLKDISLENIESPTYKMLAFNAVISGYAISENYSEAKHWYDEGRRKSIELNKYSIDNLVLLSIVKEKRKFFDSIFHDFFEKTISKVFLDALYHFEDLDKLHGIIASNLEIGDELKKEIETYLAIKKLSPTDFIDYVEKASQCFEQYNLLSLIFMGNKLFKLDENLFENVNKAINLLEVDDHQKLTLSDYYFRTEQFKQAGNCLYPLINEEIDEYIIVIYLHSLIESNQYQKANDLISNYSHLITNQTERYINLVVKLANQVQDWTHVERLLPKLDVYKDTSWYWRLRLGLTNENKREFRKLLKNVPIELDNEPENTSWIAYHEVRNNREKFAIQRAENLWRSNPTNIDILKALQSLLISELTTKRSIFFSNHNKIIDGCYIVFNEDEKRYKKFVDSCVQSTDTSRFINPKDEIGKYFLGKQVGDKFSVQGRFGITKNIEVLEIKSILSAVFHNNMALAHEVNNPFGMVAFDVELETEAGKEKFLEDVLALSNSEEHFKNQLEIYQNNPMTIALLGNLIGKDIAEITYEWMQDCRFPLKTIDTAYTTDISIDALNHSIQDGCKVVIDLFTLIEAKRLDILNAISKKTEIFISNFSMTILRELCEKHTVSIGEMKAPMTLHASQNKLIVNQKDIETLHKRSNNLTELKEFLEANAEILPAYGNDVDSDIISAINTLLPEIDKSTIRLCQEHNLPLLSLDARLRALASQVEVKSISFNDYLKELDLKIYTNFQIEQLISNRTFFPHGIELNDIANFAVRNNENLNKVINAHINFISLRIADEKLTQNINLLLKKFIKDGFDVSIGFISRVCMLLIFFLNVHGKLEFKKHKLIINNFFVNLYGFSPLTINSISELEEIKFKGFVILYVFKKPLLHIE